MKKIEQAEVKATLDEYTRQLGDEPLIITKDGKPIAALIAVDEFDLELLATAENLQFLAIMERSRARHEKEGGTSSEEVHLRLGLPQKG